MGTRMLVLGIHTLGLVLALLVITWIMPGNPVLLPSYALSGAYWLYSAWQILSGKDAMARKAEALLNRKRK